MRTTLSIDDDVLRAARQLADVRGESVGATISDLARASLKRHKSTRSRNGVRLLPVQRSGPGATLDDVNRLRDEVP